MELRADSSSVRYLPAAGIPDAYCVLRSFQYPILLNLADPIGNRVSIVLPIAGATNP
jgi:hypothetical protein